VFSILIWSFSLLVSIIVGLFLVLKRRHEKITLPLLSESSIAQNCDWAPDVGFPFVFGATYGTNIAFHGSVHDTFTHSMDNYQTNSYQNAPQIRHLDDAVARPGGPASSPWSSYGGRGAGGARGDATLQPNTGLTNSYDYALFGLAIHELLDRLRLSIVVSAVLLLLVIFFTWWTRLVRPVGLLVSFLLALLDVVLLVVEVSGLFRTTSTPLQQRHNWYYHGVATTAVDADASTSEVDEHQYSSYQQQQSRTDNGSNSKKLTELIDQTEQIGLVILFHPVRTYCFCFLANTKQKKGNAGQTISHRANTKTTILTVFAMRGCFLFFDD
jgi:hypothetical protein